MANVMASHVQPATVSRTSTFKIRSMRPVAIASRPVGRGRFMNRFTVRAAESKEADLSGEWPVNWSLASYEDVGEFFKNSLFKDEAAPGNSLKDVMATSVKSVTPETTLDSLGNIFDSISGVPVTKSQSDRTLVGVLSKKDLKKVNTDLVLMPRCSCTVWLLQALVGHCREEAQLTMSCQSHLLLLSLTTRWQMRHA